MQGPPAGQGGHVGFRPVMVAVDQQARRPCALQARSGRQRRGGEGGGRVRHHYVKAQLSDLLQVFQGNGSDGGEPHCVAVIVSRRGTRSQDGGRMSQSSTPIYSGAFFLGGFRMFRSGREDYTGMSASLTCRTHRI